MAEEHIGGGELPFLRKLVFENQINAVFSGIVKGAVIRAGRVDKLVVLASRAVAFTVVFVSWEVVQVHFAAIGVVGEQIFVELGNFIVFGDVLFMVAVELIHGLGAQL